MKKAKETEYTFETVVQDFQHGKPLTKEQAEILSVPQYTEKVSKTEEFNIKKQTTRWKKIKLWKKKNQLRAVAFNMELRSGDNVTILTFLEPNSTFVYLNHLYIWDNDAQYYNKSMGIYCNDYHQDFSLPITTKINLGEVRTALASGKDVDIEYATNPGNLRRFLKSSIHELMIRGGIIWDKLNQMTLIEILNAILSLITLIILIIFAYKSGAFAKKGAKEIIFLPFILWWWINEQTRTTTKKTV